MLACDTGCPATSLVVVFTIYIAFAAVQFDADETYGMATESTTAIFLPTPFFNNLELSATHYIERERPL